MGEVAGPRDLDVAVDAPRHVVDEEVALCVGGGREVDRHARLRAGDLHERSRHRPAGAVGVEHAAEQQSGSPGQDTGRLKSSRGAVSYVPRVDAKNPIPRSANTCQIAP